jgi:two-component system sensor histidine kinase TctE
MKRPDRPTLLRRLLLALLPALTVLASIGATLDYLQVGRLADSAYDQALANTAMGLAARLESDRDDDLPVHLSALAAAIASHASADAPQFVVEAADGKVIAGQTSLIALAAPPTDGNPSFRDAPVHGRAMRVVTYRYAGPDGAALIVVTEGLDGRRAAARHALRITALTNLLMIGAVLLVVTLGVRAALKPLHELGARASMHDTGHLRPLAVAGVPQEVRPLVDGINHLLDKLRASTEVQQAFLSASAHQLRTPLAGLQSQLDLLLDESRASPWKARLEGLSVSMRRLTRVTQQMLALARTDARSTGTASAPARSSVDLVELLQELTAQHLDIALERQVDLGLEAEPAEVSGERWMLREMAANLIDNALRYAPARSQVTLRCGTQPPGAQHPGNAFFEVEDAGPGIPTDQRERVFERFVRLSDADGSGSGLGLSIVGEVAEVHGARVRILDGQGGVGARVRVDFKADLSAI